MAISRKRSEALQKRIEKTKSDARDRVIKRGIMHFRADEDMMSELLQVAQYKKLPAGSMVRSWVSERLSQEHDYLVTADRPMQDEPVLTASLKTIPEWHNMEEAVLSKAKKLAEELLALAEEQIKLILENMGAGVVVIDASGLIQSVNSGFERLVQQRADRLSGTNIENLIISEISDRSLSVRLRECCNGGIFSAQIRSTNNELVPIELTATAFQIGTAEQIMLCILDASLAHAVL